MTGHAALDALALPLVGGAVVLVLLACSAFFSSAEIAIFSVERYRVTALAGAEDGAADVLEALRADPHRLLVTILVGNNVVNIAMSSITTVVLVALFPAGVAVTAATVLLTVVVLVFGEIVPKSYGVGNAESWALRTAPTVRRFQWLASPVVGAFDAATRRLSDLVGGESAIEQPYVTRDELAALVRSAERGGEIDADERDMVEAVLALHEVTAADVMVPRENVVAVAADASLAAAADLAATERVTRLPVYGDSLDDPLGVLDLRDAERTLALEEDRAVTDVATRTLVVDAGEPIDVLLERLQDERVQLALVADESGAVVGLVTVQDVLEEIVGDLLEPAEPSVRPVEDGVVVRGDAFLDRLDATLGTALATDAPEGVATLSAYLTDRLGRVPRDGDRLSLPAEGVVLVVEQVDGRRVSRVFVERTA